MKDGRQPQQAEEFKMPGTLSSLSSPTTLGGADDGTFGAGKGNIGAITVGGTMSGATIAANVNPMNGIFGDGDDIALASTLEGAIKSLTVVKGLGSSPNVVVAHKALGALTVAQNTYKAPWANLPNGIMIKDSI